MIIFMVCMMIVLVDTQTGGSHPFNSVNGDWIKVGALFNLRSGFALVGQAYLWSLMMIDSDCIASGGKTDRKRFQ